MAHKEQIEFCTHVQNLNPKYFKNVFVLDAGSLDINGNNQYLFSNSNYLGLDIGEGKNVDIVQKIHELSLPDNTFDTIISTEVFEHDMFYDKSIKNLYRMLKPGGLLLFTCATTGRPEHGTRKTSPLDAPLLQHEEEWSDYYKNLTEDDIREVLNIDECFSQYHFSVHHEHKDLNFWGIKNGEYIHRDDRSYFIDNSIVKKDMQKLVDKKREEHLELIKNIEQVHTEQVRRIEQEHIEQIRKIENDTQQLRGLEEAYKIRKTKQKELKKEIEHLKSSLRYRIGDAFAKAVNSPKDFILLPARLLKYLYLGLKDRIAVQPKDISNPIARMKVDMKSVSVDIILPVYNALEDVQNCIDSLYATKTFDFNLIVIDDASENETKQYLEEKSKEHGFVLLRNKENLRFTKSVNRGLEIAKSDYVVLLNSDTIVTDNWIEKKLGCFFSDSAIGIVGTLSNAASWQSVPDRVDENNNWKTNELPNGYTVAKMGKLVELLSQKSYPEVPSVNGFCFTIKRSVIDSVGFLDEKTFPNGYGEEDDFCLRTKAAGYKLAIADDTYIYHAKSKSYTKEVRGHLTKVSGENLKKKHGVMKIKQLINSWNKEEQLPAIANRIKDFLEGTVQYSTGNKTVVYTAMFGNFDNIDEPCNVQKNYDYVCFTDDENFTSSIYKVVHVPAIFDNPRKNARAFKLLSHLFLVGYEKSVWVDSSVLIKDSDFTAIIDNKLKNNVIAVFKHRDRDCIYIEGQECIKRNKDAKAVVLEQLEKYKQEGYPKDNSLIESGVLFRKNDYVEVETLNNRWWDEVDRYSIRDQVSFNYICWKLGLSYAVLDGIVWENDNFYVKKHLKDEK